MLKGANFSEVFFVTTDFKITKRANVFRNDAHNTLKRLFITSESFSSTERYKYKQLSHLSLSLLLEQSNE